MRAGMLALAPGAGIPLHGVEWTVEDLEPQAGAVVLRDAAGEVQRRPIRWLMHHPDCRPGKPAAEVAPRPRGQVLKTDLSEDQLKRARLRAEHVLEAETGYRSGHPARALPGEPRPEYYPAAPR